MRAGTLPTRTVLVIENESDLRLDLAHHLREFGSAVLAFKESAEALDWFGATERASQSELILVVGDRVSIPFMEKVGRGGVLYPATRKILYSGGASDAGIEEWKNRGVIDSYVPKGYPVRLMEEINRSIADYDQIVLADMRHYIETKCKKPRAPYYPTDDGKVLNILEVYREVMLGTTVGREAAESWLNMRRAEQAKDSGQIK